MSRLIDADKLIEQLNKENVSYNPHINEIIVNQPIAYEVEKVVEELEEMRKVGVDMLGGYCQSTISKAIDIVRKGGIDG